MYRGGRTDRPEAAREYPRRGGGYPAVAAGLLVLLALTGCGGGDRPGEAIQEARGQVLEVVARNLTELASLRIREESGRELTFVAEGFVGFTPSHLRQHQLFGQPVVVFYRERGEQLLAIRVTD